ncbi:hypothetical protein J5X84_02770 [Streptosporangiaceae bacterium NEAU-GS5]|nr:hypothetical protein [Streptosporangiaceae bacterium NEAU-GS5]
MTEVRQEQPATISVRVSFRWGPVVLVGCLIIAVSLLIKTAVMAKSYFIEDDFLFVGDAYEHGLTWDYLMRVHKGHLMPGALALVWALSRIAAYNWTLVAGVMLALQGAASAGLLVLLRRAFGDRPGVLVPLAVYCFSPLTVPALSWWSAALNAVPLQVAIAFSLAAHVTYMRTGERRHAWRGLAWALVGMAFSTKGVFVPLLTFAVSTAFLREGPWLRAVLRELRTRVWAVYGAVLAAYAVLYVLQQGTAGDEGAGAPKADVTVGLLGWMLGRTFPTGVVGGPVQWGGLAGTGGLADPPPVMIAAAWIALVLVVALTVLYRRHAWRAWVIAALWVLAADAFPTVLARGRYTSLVGTETRYVADAAIVFAICLAFAMLPLRDEREPYRKPWPEAMPLATALVTVVFVGLSLYSVNAYGKTLVAADRIRAYMDNVRATIGTLPADATVYARPLPDYAVLPWNGNRRLSSHLLAPLAADPARLEDPGLTAKPYVFDDVGRLVPMLRVFGYFDTAKSRCYPLKDGAVTFPVESAGGPEGVAALGYTSTAPAAVDVALGAVNIHLDLPAAPQSRVVYFPHPGAGQGLRVTPAGPSFCLKAAAFGAPEPS